MLTRAEQSLYRHEPSEEDVRNAKEKIAHHELMIFSLNSQISDLLYKVRIIEEEKKARTQAISKCKGVITLARRIPGELLAKIFKQCIIDGWTRAPIVVSQVCSSWREAARTPSVWSHLYIDCDNGDPVARCQLWLRMARQSLLDITLRATEHCPSLNDVLDTIIEHQAQWKSFTLETSSTQTANYIFNRCSGSTPMLTEVLVRLGDSSISSPFPEGFQELAKITALSSAFKDASNLIRLTVFADTPQSWVGLPQLTRLSLQLNLCQFHAARSIFASDIIEALIMSPNLRHLSLTIPRTDRRDFELESHSEAVVFQELVSLCINFPIPSLAFIQHLRAPKLQRLYLRCPDDPNGFAGEPTRLALRRFIRESAPPLKMMELYDVDIAQDDFIYLFSRLSTLEELRLHGSEILDETLQCISPPMSLLPHLTRIDFRWCGHISGVALESIVQNRFTSVMNGPSLSPITELTVINCSVVNEQNIVEISGYCICRLKMPEEDNFCCK